MKNPISRRNFLTRLTLGGAGAYCLSRLAVRGAASAPGLVVVHGTDIPRVLAAGIDKFGGWKAFVKPGSRVVIKPNAAWATTPEEGGNTAPLLVERSVAECLAAGAKAVIVPENPCSPARESFPRSGIADAVKRAGGTMYCPDQPKHFRKVAIPQGVSLKEASVVCDVLDCDCLVNMPVAKHHGAAQLTMSMKNWMGSVEDRGFWHRNNMHQCIADCSTLIHPALIVMDATRILTTNGPRGPGKLEYPNQIVLGTDPVAVDAYGATLFGKQPFDIQYIKLAHAMKVGCGDLALVNVEHVEC
jgi:uncharacterized protein (DUF362 family)